MNRLWIIGLLGVGLALSVQPSRASTNYPADSVGMDWSRVAEYRIVPGDQLNLSLGLNPGGDRDIRPVTVRPDGRISVFPIGDVIAAGLTPQELQTSLVRQLGTQLRDPRITVEVSNFAGNVIHVLGQVKNPGSVIAGPFMTTLQAIAGAGGFSDDAQRNSVLVFHRDGARTMKVSRIRLDRAIKAGDLSKDVVLGRFDIVYVPRNAIGNLDLFARQMFGGTSVALSAALTGWELFNLDRVFVLAR